MARSTPARSRTPRRAWPALAVALVLGLLVPAGPAAAADRQTVVTDSFERTVSGGLGTADQGGTWTVGGSTGVYAVGSGRGSLTTTPGRTLTAGLAGVSATDTDTAVTLGLSQLPTGSASIYTSLVGRQTTTSSYAARAVVGAAGTVNLYLNAGGTALTGVRVPGLTYAVGDRLRLRLQVAGTGPTTLAARVWRVGSPEPTTWATTATDTTTDLQRPGSVGLTTYLSGSATGPVTVTVDDLVATVPPAANQPPTAAFTATTTDLAVALDSGGSTDADGTLVTRAWDFGDGTGTTGTSATASHTYAAAGSYPVVLTVTDDRGGTASATRSVTVTAPPPPPPPPPSSTSVVDSFERTVTGGFGTADQGGTWTVGGSTSAYAVTGGRGAITTAPGRTSTATLPAISSTTTDAAVSIGLSRLPTAGTSVYTSLVGRQTTGSSYAARAVVGAAGTVDLYLNVGSTVLRGTRVPGLTYVVGEQLRLRVQVTGTNPTTLQARTWTASAPEPASWTLVATDATAGLQTTGSLGLTSYLSGAATSPVTVTVDDLAASVGAVAPDPGTARPTQSQWLADVDRAMSGGPDYLDTQVGAAPAPAVVLDVDNTALQSYYQPFAATPAVLAFAQRARADGFAVFVVTGRSADSGGTAFQLSTAGYVVDGICFRDPAVSGQASKEACRAARAAEGYTVVANVGNHDADLVGADSGRTFRLPDYGFLD